MPFDSSAPLDSRRAIIRRNPDNIDEVEMIEAAWGSNPRFSGGARYRFIRAEGNRFPIQRCLIPASEFHISAGGEEYRVTLDDGNFFYLAGIYEPAMADWAVCYRVITVVANPEVGRYQERHDALIHRWQVMQWLDHSINEAELLVTPPVRTFRVEKLVKDKQPARAR